MIKLKQPKITFTNSKGETKPVLLNEAEQYHAEWTQRQVNERFKNALGYEVNITTLTTILKKISMQKFFKIPPADFLPIVVGEGSWSSNLTSYRSFENGDEFETGVINTGTGNSRLAAVDVSVDSLNIKVYNWAKSIGWNIFDLELAAKSGNWDLITSLEKSRKKNWDLGIQRTAFLGMRGTSSDSANCQGLLTLAGVNVNTTRITSALSGLDSASLKTFCGGIYADFRANCNYTAEPTHFLVPESDYDGMAAQSSDEFPIKTIKQVILETFIDMTGNANFKMQKCAYADKANSGGALTKQTYALYNGTDEDTMCMNIPVDYTNTLANSIDNFSFQNAGYGQFTGVLLKRPLEVLYYQF